MWYKGNRTDASMSCLQGYVNTTYNKLIEIFGEPHYIGSSDDKVTAEWIIKFKDGNVATIYDYKMGNTPKDLYEWHIGGHNKIVVNKVKKLIG